MPRKPKDVTDAELAALQVLWERPSATIRQITDRVCPHDPAGQCSTVKRLLARLEGKGYVRRDCREAAHLFETIVGRDELIGRRLETSKT